MEEKMARKMFVTLIFFMFAAHISPIYAEGNLATQTTTLELDIKGDLTLSPKEFNLETGKYYKWIIRSDGIEEMMVQAPDIFRNVWVSQIVINDLEIHGSGGIYGIEFDDEGEVAIFLVPIRTGKFEYYVKGYENRGMVGTFNV
ncbi:MAG: hypothetical protein CFH20_00680, partial [Alphaproteobacteria bacterium MarineAlpha5_Bin10]